jgi:P27 family predicted phage terminase small subunit
MSRRKSIAEHERSGTLRPARHNRKTLAFAPGATTIADKPPTYLRKNKLALVEWRATAPFLEAEGILKQTDISLLASYCILYARWRAATLDVETNGQIITITSTTRTGRTEKPAANPACRNEVVYQAAMMRAAVKFGLNPLDRPRIEVPPDADKPAYNNDPLNTDLDDFSMPEVSE